MQIKQNVYVKNTSCHNFKEQCVNDTITKRSLKTKITHEMRNHNIFYDNVKVKKESDPVWIIICKNLNQNDPLRSLTVRNIQTHVAQNHSSSNVKPQDQEDNLKFDVEDQLLRIKNDALYKSNHLIWHHFSMIKCLFLELLDHYLNPLLRLINHAVSEMKYNEIFLNYNIEYIEELGSENDCKEFVNLEVNRNVDYNSCQKIINFITNIFVEAKSYISRDMGHELNAYYNNEFCKNLIELCIQFPLWTKVMIEGQKTESINILKSHRQTFEQHLSNSCNDSRPELDIFLLRSIEYDNEKVQFARNFVKENAIKDTKNNLENTYLYHEENWMGLNPDESSFEESSDSDVSDNFEKDTFSDNIDLFVHIPHNDSTISEIVESFCEKVKGETFYETADKSMEIKDTFSMKNENGDFRSNAETVLKTTTSTTKQKGKFLRPCPEIDLIHQKPVKDTKKQKSQSKR
ncbi:hypothetical protein TSAR_005333 [Trichomalopsis sarcophagae]|uniref:Uncharacterized protein n=1 Tax=Trichomalopsis sarcophagae TaxID=543379 RepID=A0A232ELI2_9HYME|nr:hypothetical protein TSAR_005333 [Trichomalopsis sarcophagae]